MSKIQIIQTQNVCTVGARVPHDIDIVDMFSELNE